MLKKIFGDAAIEQLIRLINTALGSKVDRVDGKSLSTNDYTDADQQKLAAIRFITVEEIDAICGSNIEVADDQLF